MQMLLSDGARIGVIGGGPAGSFCAYFLLRFAEARGIDLRVDIYEPRDFTRPGPAGCNMCGGVVSESLMHALATDGIPLPPAIVQRTITSYVFSTDDGSVHIEMPVREKRIAALHRGAGPLGGPPVEWEGLDRYLLRRATDLGAVTIPQRVDDVWRDGGRPVIRTRTGVQAYDLLVGATGVNSPAWRLFVKLGVPAARPQVTRAYITELPMPRDEIARSVGEAMHIFFLRIRRLEFAAIIPKGDVLTVCLLGRDIDRALIDAFFASAAVKRSLSLPRSARDGVCRCAPFINIGAAPQPFADRVVLVGDCGATRLYKDGVGAAYRMARAAAHIAVAQGVSAHDFRSSYMPVYRSLARDNRYGRLLFFGARQFKVVRPLLRGLLEMVAREQAAPQRGLAMSHVLWDMFTGSAPYGDILVRALDPRLLSRFFLEAIRTGARRAGAGWADAQL